MKNMAFYIDENTDQRPQIHNSPTETVCTENTSRNAKQPCFTLLSAIRVVLKNKCNARLQCRLALVQVH